MAATTKTTTVGDLKQKGVIRKLLQKVRVNLYDLLQTIFRDNFKGVVTIPTTALDDVGDKVVLFTYPAVAQLWGLKIKATDMDTNVAPGLVFDITVQTPAGAGEVVLISGATIGQAGGKDELDLNLDPVDLAVGGKQLCLKTTTVSATPAAGTLTYVVDYATHLRTATGA